MEAADLAPAFTLADARASGLRKDQVYELLASGRIERVGRGVYLRADAIDPQFAALAAATAARSEATMCLISALAYHELTDEIPFGTDVALPRDLRHPAGFANVAWHSFDRKTFFEGREKLTLVPDTDIAVYSAERTIVDCFRLMHLEGSDLAYEALRRWLRRRGSSPSVLLQLANLFPKAEPRLRQALEVLL
ncbi:MAG: type IV toxin-antitoxin system AbiEi family antitoxin domain-containing protein [Acidipropionibacterium sp.]|jgi:predicted transcriptional regulator of viral defense system|nr:type IV toxin-antitoxin system AbiEi family antitoxin domain-containing protein [Acidipropionibacterium sp.]